MTLGAGNDTAAFLLCDIGTLNIDGGAGNNYLFRIASKFKTLDATDFVNLPHRRAARARR